MKHKKSFILPLLIAIIALAESCRKDPVWNTDANFVLEFSVDTVKFDTIFTSYGSTTIWLQVYNRSNKDVDIQSITLMGGENSPFRMNVSGDTSLVQRNVRLRAKDSMFIFTKITVNPDDETLPFAIWDSIRFTFNNRSQFVILSAAGQNAHYHFPNSTDTLRIETQYDTLICPYSVANQIEFDTTDKPHIIYGYLLVQNTLTLKAGTRLHFAPNSGLIVDKGATLIVNGTFGNEVIFNGLRTDEQYKNSSGQWDCIRFLSESVDNQINWAIIKNGKTGLLIDSMANPNQLIISNTIIDNMQNYGILARNAIVQGQNVLASNCGNRVMCLDRGDYTFEHCTFVNYLSSNPAVLLNDSISLNPFEHVDFTSCIIYGPHVNELQIEVKNTQNMQNINFSYCNIKINADYHNSLIFNNCQLNKDPNFKKAEKTNADFEINPKATSETSGAVGKAKPYPMATSDLLSRQRNYERPTIGAYEFVGNIE